MKKENHTVTSKWSLQRENFSLRGHEKKIFLKTRRSSFLETLEIFPTFKNTKVSLLGISLRKTNSELCRDKRSLKGSFKIRSGRSEEASNDFSSLATQLWSSGVQSKQFKVLETRGSIDQSKRTGGEGALFSGFCARSTPLGRGCALSLHDFANAH